MKLLIVGEFPTLNESTGPFSNGFWRYFKAKLRDLGFPMSELQFVNVFNKPSGSIFRFMQESKSGAYPGLPYYAKKAYLRMEYAHELDTLYRHIKRVKPNLTLLVGDAPLWALTGTTGMLGARGRVTQMLDIAGGGKALPIMHPRMIVEDIRQEPVLIADLSKAKREMEFPELRRPRRFIHMRPTLDDLETFWNEHLLGAPVISVDIETKGTFITCVGFAPTGEHALVVPFFDEEQPSGNYWATKKEELFAWKFVRRVLERPVTEARVLGQNFTYDLQAFLKQMGIKVPGYAEDTMLLHHSLQIEMRKSLGFQASLYTDELQWKALGKRKSSDKSGKKEDDE